MNYTCFINVELAVINIYNNIVHVNESSLYTVRHMYAATLIAGKIKLT